MHIFRQIGLAYALLGALGGLATAQAPVVLLVPGAPPDHHLIALPIIQVDNGPNSQQARRAHYVVLVSLDGFRWDYAKRVGASTLLNMTATGASAPEGMIPSYPSLTFPNHYTLVTGLYPEHHGLVANHFMDETTHAHYAMTDAAAVTNGSWYSGVPLWSLAESQGMRTACLFWPGSEAKIAGFRPSYYLRYDEWSNDKARIEQVRSWLQLQEAQRPHLILFYESHPDHEGHKFGPDARETLAAALRADRLVGRLKAVLDASGLPIDLVVLSDHGMVKVDPEWVTLDQFADLSGFETVGGLLYGSTEADRERVYRQLKNASGKFVVYRRKNVPASLHDDANARSGDPIVIATGPFAIRAHGREVGRPDHPPTVGMHGFDPHRVAEMKASFFATGPDIVAGKTIAPFENVNVYSWIAHLLGLTPPMNDGRLEVLATTLRDGGVEKGKEQ